MKTLIAVAQIGFAALFGTAGVGRADNDPYAPRRAPSEDS